VDSRPGSATADPSRRRRRDGERSRDAILHEAARLATVEGLEGLSLSRLADEVGMSKSGLYAHFGSKEDLQLATIGAAEEVFAAEVVSPAAAAAAGVERLRAYADRFLAHVRGGVFPGGCFFASAAMELDTRPGIVRDRALEVVNRWLGLLDAEVRAAQADGGIDSSIASGQLAFELHAFLFLGNAQFVASADPDALERAWIAFDRRLEATAPAGTGPR